MAKIGINYLTLVGEEFSNILTSAQLKTILGGQVYIKINNVSDGINTIAYTIIGSGSYGNDLNTIDNSNRSYNFIYVV